MDRWVSFPALRGGLCPSAHRCHWIFCRNVLQCYNWQAGRKPIRTHLKRLIKISAGWAFILLGAIGLFLPILQGILFLAIGFSILATEQPWAARMLHRLRGRFPQAARTLDRAKARATAWVQRFGDSRERRYDYD